MGFNYMGYKMGVTVKIFKSFLRKGIFKQWIVVVKVFRSVIGRNGKKL